jgi:hypothetical protein
MAITHSYVDYGAGNDTTGDGTIGTPWKTLQKALDTCARNTTDGNQINVKAGTAQVLAASLSLTTFVGGGALSATAPLILRGYTSAANDGGFGEIDCGGATMFAATSYNHVILVDLEMHTFGDNDGVVLNQYAFLYRCEVHKGASSPASKKMVILGSYSKVIGCYVHDLATGTNSHALLSGGTNVLVAYCYLDMGASGTGAAIYLTGAFSTAIGNISKCAESNQYGMVVGAAGTVLNNAVYNAAAGTARGIYLLSATSMWAICLNNIVEGWSGSGGEAIRGSGGADLLGYNAVYNNTSLYAMTDAVFIDETAKDVALGASPFTSPSTGDFSLTAAAKTALAAKGWPTSYLGAHANTVPNLNIGPIQMAAGSGGGVYRAVMRTLGG